MRMIIKIIKRGIMLFNYIRYAVKGNSIGFDVEIGKNVHLRQCKIGAHSYIGNNSVINDTEIGAYCSIAPGVQIGGMEHSIWKTSTNAHLSDDCISGNITHIGADVWIAASSVIKQGVTIGQGAVVGANSFVNKDIPPYAIVVGSPAKIIKYRFNQEIIKKLIDSEYWKLSPSKAKDILSLIDN